MVAINNVVRDVLAMIEPRTPVPKGGGRVGSSGPSSGGSRSSSSSSSSSGKGNTAVGTSTSSSTTTSNYRPAPFIFISSGHGAGGGSYLPLWAFILIIILSVMIAVFIIAFICYWRKERNKTSGKTRWGKVFWGATKVATGLWLPILIYRRTCGRNRKKGSGGTFYNKIEEGKGPNKNTGADPSSNSTNASTAYEGASATKPLLFPASPEPFGATVQQQQQPPVASEPSPPPYGNGAAASYYAMAPPTSAYIPGDTKGGNPVPMSVPPASK